jgi:esterase/lipase
MLLSYNVFPFAKRILNTPTLVVVAEQDNITQWDLEIEMYNTIPAGNKELVVLEKVNHMSLYSTRRHLEAASGHHARFLKKHLIDEFTVEV